MFDDDVDSEEVAQRFAKLDEEKPKGIRVDDSEDALPRYFKKLSKQAGKGHVREESKNVRPDMMLDFTAFKEGKCPIPTDREFQDMERRVRKRTGRKL